MNFPISLLLFLSICGQSFATWHHIRDWIYPVKSADNKSEVDTTPSSVFADSTTVGTFEKSTALPTSYPLEFTTKTVANESEFETTTTTSTTSTTTISTSTSTVSAFSVPTLAGSTMIPTFPNTPVNLVETAKNESKIETTTGSSSPGKLEESTMPSTSTYSPRYTDKVAKNKSKIETTSSASVAPTSSSIENSKETTTLPASSYSSPKYTAKTVKNESKVETSTAAASFTGPTSVENFGESTTLQTSSYSPKVAEIKWDDEARGWKCRSQSNLALPCPKEEIEWLKNI
ncbi:uncharacterized protein LOC141849999 [Brevipalpus obovatus]|uniref:uncharacterized protein LOC141849999 n=1 Tax=Brevipalpus obovatus TaxID=246614 RepID=UPI003D9E83C9